LPVWVGARQPLAPQRAERHGRRRWPRAIATVSSVQAVVKRSAPQRCQCRAILARNISNYLKQWYRPSFSTGIWTIQFSSRPRGRGWRRVAPRRHCWLGFGRKSLTVQICFGRFLMLYRAAMVLHAPTFGKIRHFLERPVKHLSDIRRCLKRFHCACVWNRLIVVRKRSTRIDHVQHQSPHPRTASSCASRRCWWLLAFTLFPVWLAGRAMGRRFGRGASISYFRMMGDMRSATRRSFACWARQALACAARASGPGRLRYLGLLLLVGVGPGVLSDALQGPAYCCSTTVATLLTDLAGIVVAFADRMGLAEAGGNKRTTSGPANKETKNREQGRLAVFCSLVFCSLFYAVFPNITFAITQHQQHQQGCQRRPTTEPAEIGPPHGPPSVQILRATIPISGCRMNGNDNMPHCCRRSAGTASR